MAVVVDHQPASLMTEASPRASVDLHLPPLVLSRVVDAADLRTRMALLCTCKHLKRLCERPELWRRICFDSADEQRGLKADWLLGVLGRADGGVEVLHLARSREARDAEGQQRFSDGVKLGQLLPHTQGPAALRLAALCPRLARLSIDERASCLGGMTNCLARALAAHCPLLDTLEVYFERYSMPSELLTDEGLIALSEGCRRLRALCLVNCDHISDRSLYAVAANCRGLQRLQLGGYSENISDGGLTVLVESCTSLHTLWLSGKLLKVTDATLAAAARHCGAALARVKLTRSMSAEGLGALAGCRELSELDARHCRDDVTPAALAALARACPKLSRVALPPGGADGGGGGGADGGADGSAAGAAAAGDDDEDEEVGAVAAGLGRLAPGCSLSSARGARLLREGDVRALLGGFGVSH